jgi:ATP-dependent RNA helicase MRH4
LAKRHQDPINATHQELVTKFTAPPLMPGLLSCLTDILGPTATPTPIQSLSLKWLLDNPDPSLETEKASGWKQFLLASETGSGKSIAYLLPLLQNLKLSELNSPTPTSTASERALNPRALILAPTHELTRQLSGFAKALLHEVKLRVLCASRANVKNTKERDATTRKMIAQFEDEVRKSSGHYEDGELKKEKFPVDVVVGTPMKLLEMVRGRGWDRKEEDVEEDDVNAKLRRGRDKMVGFGKWRNPPEMGLAKVEWVIVDEADVLFGLFEPIFALR